MCAGSACFEKRLSRTRRGAVALLATLGYVASIVGFPVAAPKDARHAGAPYPCQSHACGCTSAEDCWRDCCCFTPEERLSWAARHGVTPPSEVATRSLPRQRAGQAKRSCCTSRAACCEAADLHEHDPPGRNKPIAPAAACCAKAPANESLRVQWVLGIQARGCRGHGTSWIVFQSPIAPPPPRLVWRPCEAVLGTVAEAAQTAPETAYAPPTRPG